MGGGGGGGGHKKVFGVVLTLEIEVLATVMKVEYTKFHPVLRGGPRKVSDP